MQKIRLEEKGITLIALIITIIVMLILVGVTITVVLNGGLFTTAQDAATNTMAEAEKEQLLSAVVGAIGTDGKVDSTKISLPEGFEKDETKSTETKLVVKGKKGIYWEVNLDTVAIKEYEDSDTSVSTYTFKLGELVSKGEWTDMGLKVSLTKFWPENASEELKDSKTEHPVYPTMMNIYNNVTCSDPNFPNMSAEDPETPQGKCFALLNMGEDIYLNIKLSSDAEYVDSTNWENYKEISFTISK